MDYKNLTSVAISEIDGQKLLAFSYDEINEQGVKTKVNVMGSRVVLKIPANKEILDTIRQLEEYTKNIINNQ